MDPARVDKDGNSPFLVACQEGHLDVIRYLTGPPCSVDVERPSTGGWTPFSCACFQGCIEVTTHASIIPPQGLLNLETLLSTSCM